MTDPRPLNEPDLSPEESAVAAILERDRPLPKPGFRGALARRLQREDPGWGPRPERLWMPALGVICVGTVLLVVGALIGVGGN